MLVANQDGRRVDAELARRGVDFRCPDCAASVILRRGRKVVAHFAHRPRATCSAHFGETRGHLEAKRLLLDALRARGLRAEVEYATIESAYDRRADVMVWAPNSGTPIAIELQHSRINIFDLEGRANSLARSGIGQFWIPFLEQRKLQAAEKVGPRRYRISRYPIQLHELWMWGMAGPEGMWMYDPAGRVFWQATITDQMLMTRETLWYEMGAVKRYRQGGERRSRQFRVMHLIGPWSASELRLQLSSRPAEASEWFNWPEARIATFVPHVSAAESTARFTALSDKLGLIT